VQPEVTAGRLEPSKVAPRAPEVVLGRRWIHRGPHVAVRRPHVVVREGQLRYLQAPMGTSAALVRSSKNSSAGVGVGVSLEKGNAVSSNVT